MTTYKIDRALGIVTVYPANLPPGSDPQACAVDLNEHDLREMLAYLIEQDQS